jgi:nitrite reductase/ring-hydroxylating ferredoxin subunit
MSHYLCKIAEISENGKEIRMRVAAVSSFIMLFRHAGTVSAFLNVCPHEGKSLNSAPDRFLFSPENWLVCAHHGASFDLETGECRDGPCRGASLRSVRISLHEGSVWLDEVPG